MIDANKRKAIFLLHNEGMGVREISRNLRVSTNTVSKIIAQKGQFPETIRQDKISVDPELLRALYVKCDGYPSIKRLSPSRHDWNEVLQQNYRP